jgi:CRP-like cAMP-binding protein
MNIINHSFFTFFEPDVARAIARKADILTFVDGQIIFAEGDKQDGIYLVIEGAVAISKRDQNGHNTVIAHIYADDFFGEFAILDGRARSASVHAISPLIVVHLKTEDVAENLKSAKTNFELTNKIIGRIRVSNEKHANDYLQQERLIMLGKITSSIIENFRNPFTALYMFTEMVKKKSPELNPYCVIAQEQIDRMSGMADEILEFSSGDINIKKKKIESFTVIRSI